jgi:hypothetical protein
VVELRHHDGARHLHLGALSPDLAGRLVDALVGRDHEQGAVGRPQPGAQLPDEVGVAGGVDQVDLGVAVDERGDGERHRPLVAALGVLEVGDGGALRDRPGPGNGAGRRQQRLDQGGLA